MGLQSQLFRGDQQLEACLVKDSAHVVPGAIGTHVGKIQTALLTLDNPVIDASELAAQRYGPSTAAGVLAYKRKRKIINFSYQTQADNIVGKMTIASLDREMVLEETHICPVDTCVMNTKGGEIVPAGSSPDSIPSSPAVTLTAAPVTQQPQTARDAALQAVPLARFWVSLGAIPELSVLSVLQFVADLKTNPSLSFPSVFDIVNTHFHLDRDAKNLRRHLQRLVQVFNLIQQTLLNASTFFQNGPAIPKSFFADAPMGGFQLPNTKFNRITFRPGFLTCGPSTRAAMIVHECAHFVGGINVINHFAMEFPAPQGQPQGKGHTRNYQDLLTSEALRNAASYAAYAIHAATLHDLRFGAQNISL